MISWVQSYCTSVRTFLFREQGFALLLLSHILFSVSSRLIQTLLLLSLLVALRNPDQHLDHLLVFFHRRRRWSRSRRRRTLSSQLQFNPIHRHRGGADVDRSRVVIAATIHEITAAATRNQRTRNPIFIITPLGGRVSLTHGTPRRSHCSCRLVFLTVNYRRESRKEKACKLSVEIGYHWIGILLSFFRKPRWSSHKKPNRSVMMRCIQNSHDEAMAWNWQILIHLVATLFTILWNRYHQQLYSDMKSIPGLWIDEILINCNFSSNTKFQLQRRYQSIFRDLDRGPLRHRWFYTFMNAISFIRPVHSKAFNS